MAKVEARLYGVMGVSVERRDEGYEITLRAGDNHVVLPVMDRQGVEALVEALDGAIRTGKGVSGRVGYYPCSVSRWWLVLRTDEVLLSVAWDPAARYVVAEMLREAVEQSDRASVPRGYVWAHETLERWYRNGALPRHGEGHGQAGAET